MRSQGGASRSMAVQKTRAMLPEDVLQLSSELCYSGEEECHQKGLTTVRLTSLPQAQLLCLCMCHASPRSGLYIRTIQGLLDHKDVNTR